jgi:hypothetical protein
MKRVIALAGAGAVLAAFAALAQQSDAPPSADIEKQLNAPTASGPKIAAPSSGIATEENAAVPKGTPVALLMRGLDKMTGRPADIIAPMNTPVKFATLTITVHTCYSTPPTEPPETDAFLEIVDNRPDQPAKKVFSGWMFASSPSLNGMEHPLYDVWVISCKTNEPGTAAPGVVASVTPTKAPAKAVSPNAGAEEEMPALPEGAGQ